MTSRWPRATTVLVAAVLAGAVIGPRVDAPRVEAPSVAIEPRGDARAGPSEDPAEQLDAALIDAAWANDVAEAARLIDAGADVNARDWTRQSAYLIAASEGHLELLELTLRSGAFVPLLDSYRGTALIRAAERGHARVVGRLLQEDTMPVDHVNRLGWTALHEAVILGDGSERYIDTVRLLVAGGADLDRVSVRDDLTALQHARDLAQSDVVDVLEAARRAAPPADPTATLLTAARDGDADLAAIAIRHGADREGSAFREALRIADDGGHAAVVRLLRALGGRDGV